VGVLSWGAGMYFESGSAPGPAGQHHPLASPYGRFRARGGYMNIAAGNDAMWEKLAREMLVELPHPEVGTFKTTGLPVKLSRSPGGVHRSPPRHGEHTEEVLLESGLSREEIAQLRRSKVI
jgi:crotonobetainyl-CoA:carnitine CoA-transferase CaiB-like acyl-CoA transferase